jgi:hypothetical protein
MLGHRPKIVVIVQQRPTILDAPGSNQEVDGFAHRDAVLAERSKIA